MSAQDAAASPSPVAAEGDEDVDPLLTQFAEARMVGLGGEGVVYAVRRKSGDPLMILKKKLCTSLDEANDALGEALTMARVNCPYVVKYEDVFLKQRDREHFYLCIMMEFCDGGDLCQFIMDNGAVSSKQLLEWTYQLLVGLERVHELSLVHRDIKGDNVFLAKEGRGTVVKIGDFGIATQLARNQKAKERQGTWTHMAPEVIARQPYTNVCDIWSLGCVLVEMASGQLLAVTDCTPGEDATRDPEWTTEAFLRQHLPSRVFHRMPDFVAVVRTMLVPDPLQRATASQLLAHNLFKKLTAEREDTLGALDTSGAVRRRGATVRQAPRVTRTHRRLLTMEYVPAAASLLANALMQDPTMAITLRNLSVHARTEMLSQHVLPALLESSIRSSNSSWAIWDGPILAGVSVWIAPHAFSQYRKLDKVKVPVKGRVMNLAWKRMAKAHAAIMRAYAKHFRQEHYFMWVLGVHTRYQGSGFGTNILKPLFDWADHGSLDCGLYTGSEAAVRFFNKFCFQVVERVTLNSTSNPEVFILKRPGQHVRESWNIQSDSVSFAPAAPTQGVRLPPGAMLGRARSESKLAPLANAPVRKSVVNERPKVDPIMDATCGDNGKVGAVEGKADAGFSAVDEQDDTTRQPASSVDTTVTTTTEEEDSSIDAASRAARAAAGLAAASRGRPETGGNEGRSGSPLVNTVVRDPTDVRGPLAQGSAVLLQASDMHPRGEAWEAGSIMLRGTLFSWCWDEPAPEQVAASDATEAKDSCWAVVMSEADVVTMSNLPAAFGVRRSHMDGPAPEVLWVLCETREEAKAWCVQLQRARILVSLTEDSQVTSDGDASEAAAVVMTRSSQRSWLRRGTGQAGSLDALCSAEEEDEDADEDDDDDAAEDLSESTPELDALFDSITASTNTSARNTPAQSDSSASPVALGSSSSPSPQPGQQHEGGDDRERKPETATVTVPPRRRRKPPPIPTSSPQKPMHETLLPPSQPVPIPMSGDLDEFRARMESERKRRQEEHARLMAQHKERLAKETARILAEERAKLDLERKKLLWAQKRALASSVQSLPTSLNPSPSVSSSPSPMVSPVVPLNRPPSEGDGMHNSAPLTLPSLRDLSSNKRISRSMDNFAAFLPSSPTPASPPTRPSPASLSTRRRSAVPLDQARSYSTGLTQKDHPAPGAAHARRLAIKAVAPPAKGVRNARPAVGLSRERAEAEARAQARKEERRKLLESMRRDKERRDALRKQEEDQERLRTQRDRQMEEMRRAEEAKRRAEQERRAEEARRRMLEQGRRRRAEQDSRIGSPGQRSPMSGGSPDISTFARKPLTWDERLRMGGSLGSAHSSPTQPRWQPMERRSSQPESLMDGMPPQPRAMAPPSSSGSGSWKEPRPRPMSAHVSKASVARLQQSAPTSPPYSGSPSSRPTGAVPGLARQVPPVRRAYSHSFQSSGSDPSPQHHGSAPTSGGPKDVCPTCRIRVQDHEGASVLPNGQLYHEPCFRCQKCRASLNGRRFRMEGRHPVCPFC